MTVAGSDEEITATGRECAGRHYVRVNKASHFAQKVGFSGALLAIHDENRVGSTRLESCEQNGETKVRAVNVHAPK
jgi:hypothetical protein